MGKRERSPLTNGCFRARVSTTGRDWAELPGSARLAKPNIRHSSNLTRFPKPAARLANPDQGQGSYFAAEAGETWDAIGRQTPWLERQTDIGPFVRMKRDAGQFYPRIARPLAPATHANLWTPDLPQEQRYIAGAQNQLQALVSELPSICRVVQPAPTTLVVYDHEIRNVLILASAPFACAGRPTLEVRCKNGPTTAHSSSVQWRT